MSNHIDDDNEIDAVEFHDWLEELFPSKRTIGTQTFDVQRIKDLLSRLPNRGIHIHCTCIPLPIKKADTSTDSTPRDILRTNLQLARNMPPPSAISIVKIREILQKLRCPHQTGTLDPAGRLCHKKKIPSKTMGMT